MKLLDATTPISPQTSAQAPAGVEKAGTQGWPVALAGYPVCESEGCADLWVKLTQPLSEYAHDEALVLCPASDETWVTWIPNHGQAILHRDQFIDPMAAD